MSQQQVERSTNPDEGLAEQAKPVSSKAEAVKAVAAAVSAEKVSDPTTRARVEAEVGRELERRDARGLKAPSIQIYDARAPARSQEIASPSVDRNSERIR